MYECILNLSPNSRLKSRDTCYHSCTYWAEKRGDTFADVRQIFQTSCYNRDVRPWGTSGIQNWVKNFSHWALNIFLGGSTGSDDSNQMSDN